MGMFEYVSGLAKASTPEEMEMVSSAFKAGQLKERERIEQKLIAEANGKDHLEIALFKLKDIIYEN